VAGALSLDPERQAVSLGGAEPVRLTPLEFRLLQLMIAHAGHPVTMERITSHVWGYRGMGDRQLLKQLVHRLRQKIEKDPSQPEYLVTLSGVGYILQTESA
jgi:DNA-binding response OmpR family regulator